MPHLIVPGVIAALFLTTASAAAEPAATPIRTGSRGNAAIPAAPNSPCSMVCVTRRE